MFTKRQILAASFLCVIVGAAHAQLSGYTAYFTMTTPYWSSDSILRIDGARVNGLGLTINDAVDLAYSFRSSDASLNLLGATVTTAAGVTGGENTWMTSADVSPTQPIATPSGQYFVGSGSYQVTSSTLSVPFVLNVPLNVGHVVSWLISGPIGDFSYSLTTSSGSVVTRYDGSTGNGVISGPVRIKKADTYRLTVTPRAGTNSVTFSLKFWNGNNRMLDTLANGSRINDTFTTSVREYSKHLIALSAGQSLSLPDPIDSNISMALVDSYSRPVASVNGLPLSFTATRTDNYYLFIYNKNGWGSSYSGSVTIIGASTAQMAKDILDQNAHIPYDFLASPMDR